MNTTIVISEVLSTSWKNVKSQIWILAGLFIGLCLIAFTVSLLMMPLSASMGGGLLTTLISALISSIFAFSLTTSIYFCFASLLYSCACSLFIRSRLGRYVCANHFAIASIVGSSSNINYENRIPQKRFPVNYFFASLIPVFAPPRPFVARPHPSGLPLVARAARTLKAENRCLKTKPIQGV